VKRILVVGAAALALVVPAAAQAFSPNDPLASRQWYLTQDKTFDAFNLLPLLPNVRVAVIDSGADVSHPELRGRIVASRSFVGGYPWDDSQGHGTFVAGEIAAAIDNGRGIAGLAPSARLLIAKVVRNDGTVSPQAEAQAIRWAVGRGARVVNVSLAGARDPSDGVNDGFSAVEQRAVDYATAHGALVVASVGNNPYPEAGIWHFAGYPAALPHVLGVGSFGKTGDVSAFSNRDDLYVDLAAPGEDMFSLLPRTLTSKSPGCADQGYSDCGPKDFRHASGTSFSAAQVSAAAALLFSLHPSLRPDQVSDILERTSDPATVANGCSECLPGRDAATGWGRLDFTAAVRDLKSGPLPVRDRLEPNDDIPIAKRLRKHLARVHATCDYWDDPNDVYRVHLRPGQRVRFVARTGLDVDVSLALWKPGLRTLVGASSSARLRRSVHSVGVPERLVYRATKAGWYSLQVSAAKPGSGSYSLTVKKS
jgi:subtilisin family serine protease